MRSDDRLLRPADIVAKENPILPVREIGGYPGGEARIVQVRADAVLVARFLPWGGETRG